MSSILIIGILFFNQIAEDGVIEATYIGRIEEPRLEFIYQFYHLQDRPPPESASIEDLSGIIESFDKTLSESEGFPFLKELIMGQTLFLYNLGESYDIAKSKGEAYLRNPMGQGKGRSEVLYNLAESYYYTKDYTSAEKFFKEVVEKFPTSEVTPFARASLGWIYLHQARWDEANSEFSSIIVGKPNPTLVALSIYGTGILFYNVELYDTAVRFFNFEEEDYKKEKIFCDLAKELLDRNLYYAGMCYYRLNYHGSAIDAWKKLIRDYLDSPYTPDAAVRLGDLFFRKEMYEDATTFLELGAERNPDSLLAKRALIQVAQCYYNLKDDEKAQEKYEELLSKSPEDSDILAGMEASLNRSARTTDSAEVLEEILKKFENYIPKNEDLPELSYKLGEMYFTKGRYIKAAEVFRQTVHDYSNSPEAPEAQLRMADCYIRLKDWESTVRAYKDFITNFPKNEKVPGATYYLGVTYDIMAKNDPKRSRDYYRKAIKVFDQLIEKFPESEWAKKAKEPKKACENAIR